MVTDNNNINNILGLHFAGERLTEEQESELVNWICQHKEEFGKMSELFQTTES